MSLKVPFTFDVKSVEGHVVIPCPDRDYGIRRILVPDDFWPEGKFILAKVWNVTNPIVYSDGSFHEVRDEGSLFGFSPCTANTTKLHRFLRGITNPVYAASRSIRCWVDWPEMVNWKEKQNNDRSFNNTSPMETDSPVRYLLENMESGVIKAIPFGDGRMIPDDSAELDYLANA